MLDTKPAPTLKEKLSGYFIITTPEPPVAPITPPAPPPPPPPPVLAVPLVLPESKWFPPVPPPPSPPAAL